MIGRFDDARPRRIGVRHVDGEKLRGRAYAEEGHSFFLFPSLMFCIFALLTTTTRVVVDALLGRFWSAEKRALKSEEKERKRVSKTIMMMIMIMIITTTTRDGMNNNTYIYKYSLARAIIARLFSSSSSSVCLRLYPFYAARFSEWPLAARVPSPVRDGFCAPPRLLLRLRF